MKHSSSTNIVTAAAIIGGAILVGSWFVKTSLDRTNNQLAEISSGLAETRTALQAAAQAQPAPARPPARRGPDPNRRHSVKLAGAPKKGPDSAKVKIVEFSDFQ